MLFHIIHGIIGQYIVHYSLVRRNFMEKYDISPFVKWAGGKRQLLNDIKQRMPENYNNYIEPFLGGGAVLLDLQPKVSVVNDINKALINAYKQIKSCPEEISEGLQALDVEISTGNKVVYYDKRQHFNDKLMKSEYDIELACLLIFLNKHCFNGLYRVNSEGLFNVPYNNSKRISFDIDNINGISKYLQNVEILQGDFSVACDRAEKGDFVFIDSPYAPVKYDSFESYTKEGFDKKNHIRLAMKYKELTDKGCYCMLTNHNTEFINELYRDFKIDVVQVKRMINRDANHRVGEEVIIRNY